MNSKQPLQKAANTMEEIARRKREDAGEEDGALVEAYLNGEEEALDRLVGRYAGPMYRFALRFVGPDDAADVAQDALVKIWRNLKKFSPGKKFSVWAFTIARNAAIDFLRKRKRTIPFSEFDAATGGDIAAAAEDPDPLPDDLLHRRSLSAELLSAVGTLPALYQTVVMMRIEENLTFDEIGEVLGISSNTLKSRYRRALGRLRTALGGKFSGTAPEELLSA